MSNPTPPPLFVQSCRELLDRLKGRKGEEAVRLRLETEALLTLFDAWARIEPPAAERSAAINRLFALYREVLTFCIKK